MAEILTTTEGIEFLVDADDAEWVEQYRWSLTRVARRKQYVTTEDRELTRGYPRRIHLRLHRLLVGAKDGEWVDHINGDTLDNRRCNLRIATPSQNQYNRRLNANSKTGFKGVSWKSRDRRFAAQIRFEGRLRHIGYFVTAEEAARAYDAKAREYFGAFAVLNFPKSGAESGAA